MATRSLTRYIEQELGKLPHFFICAILEWVLIVLLFLDGILSFVANEFAKFFELKTPCLLCTRIDHVLVHRHHDFYYNDSVCEAHQKAVSSLAYCHNHKKLSDIRKMCEGCLLSFATEKESDTATYKSLVGILHKDLECFVEDDQQIQLSLLAGKKDEELLVEKSSTNWCSCCGEPLKVKSSYPKGKNAALFTQAPAPSPRAHPHVTSKNEETRSLELPHIRYKELKFMSDNDSEIAEDEDASSVNNQDTQFREDAKAASVPLLTESEELNDESNKTPTSTRGSRLFGIPLTDSASNSPRWTSRIHRKSPLEKTEFAPDSSEGNVSNEGDGDSILHHLKRQVRLDRKSLMALYMELDEERSASAVAANNAMAMITRLQAEKANVQMEALQYQRMMEEQAEYDQEDLQATNEMLSKREEELKALEAELEIYREKCGCLTDSDFMEIRDKSGEEYNEFKSQFQSFQSGGKSECVSPPFSINEWESIGENGNNHDEVVYPQRENGGVELNDPVKDVKGEKTYLLGRLKKLERKAHTPDNGVHSSQASPGSINNIDDETGQGSQDTLTRELSLLSERVKALEADSGFLEHASKKLETNGEDLNIFTEISQNLHKLRHLLVTSNEADNV
ncbi:Myosin-binding protein [Quillaja saponaria]|uniref:Myosin-binding protein n=1 Tax=Quillaja saponaria TaxID=32244 RepID=A0AAD7PIN4_QUISA|nr:Myosin-binding protein [Quillaja saponaria]